eukprot:4498653-Prymnesium_polylepis.1
MASLERPKRSAPPILTSRTSSSSRRAAAVSLPRPGRGARPKLPPHQRPPQQPHRITHCPMPGFEPCGRGILLRPRRGT